MVIRTNKVKSDWTFDAWLQAFLAYATVYVQYHPSSTLHIQYWMIESCSFCSCYCFDDIRMVQYWMIESCYLVAVIVFIISGLSSIGSVFVVAVIVLMISGLSSIGC